MQRRAPARVDEHRRRCVALPAPGFETEIGGQDGTYARRQPVDRGLVAGADAEDLGVIVDRAELRERSRGHRYLPELAVLLSRWEGRDIAKHIREDFLQKGPQLRVVAVLELAQLAVGQHRLLQA